MMNEKTGDCITKAIPNKGFSAKLKLNALMKTSNKLTRKSFEIPYWA